MPIVITGKTYYRTAEACQMAGISKNTLFRWIREGLFTDVKQRDRRGWRLFTEKEIETLKAEFDRIQFMN
jgi:DNA-binding transcriptional MerR regulator